MGNVIEAAFAKMGARAKVGTTARFPLRVDIQHDRQGEFFSVRHAPDIDLSVLEVTPWNRHLLLAATQADGVSTFLCGRDEFHWFVAAIPETANAQTVQAAKDALKPDEVWQSIAEHRVPEAQKDSRRNEAFVRQGEWFFLPRPWLEVDESKVLKHEPIARGGGKPHICRRLYRIGGEKVYVCDAFPNGLSVTQFKALSKSEKRQHNWRRMVRDARVFVKGTIEHPDHKTIWLPYWHQVVMNTETRARAMRDVAFLD